MNGEKLPWSMFLGLRPIGVILPVALLVTIRAGVPWMMWLAVIVAKIIAFTNHDKKA
jgi:hypothetical protein